MPPAAAGEDRPVSAGRVPGTPAGRTGKLLAVQVVVDLSSGSVALGDP